MGNQIEPVFYTLPASPVFLMILHERSTLGAPRTSILGVIPKPGAIDAAIRPLMRCGAPSAVLTVT